MFGLIEFNTHGLTGTPANVINIMTIYSIIFYLLAAVILVTTGLAITRRDMVHAIVYLIFSFFGSAMLFYLFGAPFLAVSNAQAG